MGFYTFLEALFLIRKIHFEKMEVGGDYWKQKKKSFGPNNKVIIKSNSQSMMDGHMKTSLM